MVKSKVSNLTILDLPFLMFKNIKQWFKLDKQQQNNRTYDDIFLIN